MQKFAASVVAIALVGLVACTGTEECPDGASCPPENAQPVPDVVGMQLAPACRTMAESDYAGGLRKIIEDSAEPAGTILRLETHAGETGSEGQVIMMHIAGPVSTKNLPRGCVTRVPGTF